MFSRTNNITQSVYSIKDAFAKLVTILFALLMLFLSIGSFVISLMPESHGAMFLSISSGILAVASFFRYSAIRDGYKLDLENHTISFPGGGNAANDVTDYIAPDFLLQYFKRKSIDLGAISEIRRKDTKHTIKGTVYQKHLIEFVGTFGATEVPFSNKAKRDELFNAIRLSNGMGTPVFAATQTGNSPGAMPHVGGGVLGNNPHTSSSGHATPPVRSLFGKKH